jgi:hypothetical protein
MPPLGGQAIDAPVPWAMHGRGLQPAVCSTSQGRSRRARKHASMGSTGAWGPVAAHSSVVQAAESNVCLGTLQLLSSL